MNKILLKKCIAEFIGTFVLVFFACGVAAVTGNLVATAFAFGLVIVAMAYSIGRISGCHINPAVSLACLIEKKMTLVEFVMYVAAQVLGGIAGALLLFGILKMNNGSLAEVGTACNYTATQTLKAGPIFSAILFEIVLTCVFVFVILHVTDDKSEKVSGKLAGIIIGLTLTLVHLLGIFVTGTSVNPARSLATAISSVIYGQGTLGLKHVWIFIIAPFAGGAIAAVLHTLLTKDAKEETKDEAKEEKAE